MIQKQKCFQSCSRGNYGGFFFMLLLFSLACPALPALPLKGCAELCLSL